MMRHSFPAFAALAALLGLLATPTNAARTDVRDLSALERAADLALLAFAHSGRARLEAKLKSGETLHDVITRAGGPRGDAVNATAALGRVYDARDLKAGQAVQLYVKAGVGGNDAQLTGLSLAADEATTVLVSRQADGRYAAREFTKDAHPVTKRLTGEISISFYVDAIRSGAPATIVAEIADLLTYSVDFQREVRAGDGFEIVYEDWVDKNGESVKPGDLRYFSFSPRGKELAFWRFASASGQGVEYFNNKAESARRFLIKTPVDYTRLSSHFGPRRHPVLGYNRVHKGTDFAAPRGSRVYAAGEGVIERANRYGSFGNYIRIRHSDGYKTAYAHLNGFARGIRKGKRVRQGQVIGYVGTTGRSTGPHLHYEVLKNGVHVNPMRLDIPTGRVLKGEERAAFDVERAFIDAKRTQLEASEPSRLKPG